jgi:hypothetical protein
VEACCHLRILNTSVHTGKGILGYFEDLTREKIICLKLFQNVYGLLKNCMRLWSILYKNKILVWENLNNPRRY